MSIFVASKTPYFMKAFASILIRLLCLFSNRITPSRLIIPQFIYLVGLSLLFTSTYGQTFIGSWRGEINTGAIALRVNIHISQEDDSTYAGTFDSPDQGAYDLSFSSVTVSNNTLTCKAANMGIVLTAEAMEEGDLEARWVQGGAAFPMQFVRFTNDGDDLTRKPQDPSPPFPYSEEHTYFVNANNDTIHGTFTLPKGKGPFPGVVLITGSGPQNRNSEILGHRPFWVLADHLTREGIAVFRYDERGVGESGGDFQSATSQDFAHDASLALKHLAQHKLVDNKRAGLFGHSEGGMVAGIVNAEFIQPSFLILAAAPGIPIPELLYKQTEDIMRGQNVSKETRDELLQRNAIIYELMINSKQLDDAFKKVNGYFEKEIQRAEDQNDIQKTDALKSSQKEINQSVLTPWFFYFIQFNPRAVYSGINIPTLVINGKTDVQVWWEDNTQGIKNIVNDAGHQDIEVITYHQLNHLFQTSESGLPLEYASNEETFNESVMRDIAAFILTQKKGKKISD